MSDRPIRSVLLLCWRDIGHPQGGGSETYLERIGAHLAESGVRVTLRTARYPGAPRREVVDGVQSHSRRRPLLRLCLGGVGDGRGADRSRSAATGAAGCGRRHPERVAVHGSSRVRPRRVAVLVHHCHREQWPVAGPVLGRIGWFVESRLSPRVHRRNQYVTVSLPSARDLTGLGVNPNHIAVVRNGLDQAPYADIDCAAGRPRQGSRCCQGWCRTSRSRMRWMPSPSCDRGCRICTSTFSAAAGGNSGSSTTPRCWVSPTP